MIDIFALALTHGIMALAIWKLLGSSELDGEPPEDRPRA